MDFLINTILYLTALFVPVILLAISYLNYQNKIKIFEVLLKLFLTLFGHFLATYIVIYIHILIFSDVTAASENGVEDVTLKYKFIHLTIVLVYAIFGAFLCWFARGSFFETFSTFNPPQKAQSIFGD